MDEFDDLYDKIIVKQSKEYENAEKKIKLQEEIKGLSLTESEYNKFTENRGTYRPSLYDLNLALDDTIVGEYKTRLSACTSFVLAKIPVYISGPSAGGKSVIMEACANCLMPSDALIIEGGSDKAIFDQQNEIKKASYVIIREINKVNPMMEEILKSWGEGKEYIYKRSGGITGTLTPFSLPARPFMFSRADESAALNIIGAELMSRIVEIAVNGSQDQTKAVLSRQAANVENPFDVVQTDMVKRASLRWHISNTPDFDIYVNPAGQKLMNYIPTVFTTARRDFPKYIKNCEGIARFFHMERMTAMIQDKSVIFVTPQDMFLNHMIFGDNLIQSALRCSDLEKLMMQVIIKNGSLSKTKVQSKLRTWSLNVTTKTVGTHLDHLADLGYLDTVKESSTNYYTVSDFYKEFDIRPDFEEVVGYCKATMESISHYESFASEYAERFCDLTKLTVTNPFDGETINILDHDFGSAFDINSGDTRMKQKLADLEVIEEPQIKKGNTLDAWA